VPKGEDSKTNGKKVVVSTSPSIGPPGSWGTSVKGDDGGRGDHYHKRRQMGKKAHHNKKSLKVGLDLKAETGDKKRGDRRRNEQ